MMKLLNIAPLRDVMTNYLRRSWIPLGNDYSVTDLLKPPRVVQLDKRYRDVLNKRPITDEEIRSTIKSYVGTAVHDKLAKDLWSFNSQNPQVGYLIERKLMDKICDRRIVGKFDCFLNGALYDWKTTSVWKYIYKQYKDFEDQLNIYAYLIRECGMSVNILYVILWFTDWQIGNAINQQDYPSQPIEQVMIDKLWKLEVQREFLIHLIEKHKANEDRLDEDLDPCTKEERWDKPTTYAVTSPGAARAVRVLNTEDEANAYIANSNNKAKDKWFVECRPGKRVRCEDYCRCNEFCSQYQEYKQQKGEVE